MAFVWQNQTSQSDIIDRQDIIEIRDNINIERQRRFFQPYNFLAPLTERLNANVINELITAMNGITETGLSPVEQEQIFGTSIVQSIKDILNVFNGKVGVPHYQWIWKGVRSGGGYYSLEWRMYLHMYWENLSAVGGYYGGGNDEYGWYGWCNDGNTKLYLAYPVLGAVGDTTIYSCGRSDYEITSWTWE